MEDLQANPFFNQELLKMLKKGKPNEEEEAPELTSDLYEVLDLFIGKKLLSSKI